MIDQEVQKEIRSLMELYEARWRKPVEPRWYTRMLTQNEFCLVLRRIVDTGEGVPTGWECVQKQMRKYYERISPKERQASRGEEGTVLKEACPFCGKRVRMWSLGSYGQSWVIRCGMSGCLHMEIRGAVETGNTE